MKIAITQWHRFVTKQQYKQEQITEEPVVILYYLLMVQCIYYFVALS